jgi:hypothetical protein
MDWNDEKVDLWFRTSNPLLGNVSPNQMIALDREDRLRDFIYEAELVADAPTGNPNG